jgi:hypothetical protein
MSRPHSLRWLGAGLASIGGLSLLYACSLLAWQYASRLQTGNWIALPLKSVFGDPAAPFLPQLPAEWLGDNAALAWVLERLHIGVPFALVGFVLLFIGVRMVLRQNETLRMEQRAAADRMRRVRLGQYGDPGGRREPYIGASAPEVAERQRKAA